MNNTVVWLGMFYVSIPLDILKERKYSFKQEHLFWLLVILLLQLIPLQRIVCSSLFLLSRPLLKDLLLTPSPPAAAL